MKHCWKIFVLWVFWVFILWLVISYLDLTAESSSQEKRMYLIPWHRNCSWFKFGKCGCLFGNLSCSSCHHTVREWNWFEACHEKITGMNQAPVQDLEADMGNQITGPFICPSNASDQGSWKQLL
uniref:uncharacterized protein C20orf173 homolog n=1 Tax=Ictidomys tridecemlineatus TaxID=43179 RepID=UPI001A9F8F43|nr:uncharacterized protein C20orf173 homolog [Ictidomys tridecemlineatus]